MPNSHCSTRDRIVGYHRLQILTWRLLALITRCLIYEQFWLWEYTTVYSNKSQPKFQTTCCLHLRCHRVSQSTACLAYSSTLMIEMIWSFKSMVYFRWTTQQQEWLSSGWYLVQIMVGKVDICKVFHPFPVLGKCQDDISCRPWQPSSSTQMFCSQQFSYSTPL